MEIETALLDYMPDEMLLKLILDMDGETLFNFCSLQ